MGELFKRFSIICYYREKNRSQHWWTSLCNKIKAKAHASNNCQLLMKTEMIRHFHSFLKCSLVGCFVVFRSDCLAVGRSYVWNFSIVRTAQQQTCFHSVCVVCVCEWLWITNIKSIIIIRLNSDCLKRCSHIWIVVNANSAQIFIICIICVWWLNQIALLKCKSMRYNPSNIMRLDRFQLTMVLFIARLDAESLSLRLESLLTHLMCRRDERGRMCLLPEFRYETIQNN